MKKENVRNSFNKFLKMYFDSCREVYDDIGFEKIKGRRFQYLKTIKKLEPTTLTKLAEELCISKPSCTEVITKLEKNKLIKKNQCKEDKRKVLISLTETGTLLATTNKLESQKAVKNIFNTLSAEEVETLTQLFDKFGGIT
ncbi:MAG: MarR family transcriptional regulator [Candidatus Izimaplasma sp.]|nr:MarR family transcriptional regulator [Candidatus Izimaplasma bacterium]